MKRLLLIILLLILMPATHTEAAQIKWAEKTYSHVSENEDLVDLLRDFCSSQGINVIISERVQGKLSGRFEGYTPEAFLRHLAAAYGMIWYYDGHALHVYRSDELQSRMMELEYVSVQRFMQILEKLDIADERFPLKALDDEGIVYISGPARYVSLVTETAEMLEARAMKVARSRKAHEVIRIFPLKYAWAHDLTFNFMNDEVTVPGVASMLKNILAGRPAPGLVAGKQKKRLPATLEKLKGKGLASEGKAEADPKEEGQAGEGKDQGQTGAAAEPEAFIQADTRLNAVIIRDKSEKMPHYGEIISLLDVPVGLVQVQATIVDINTDFLRELGVDWKVETGRVVSGTGTDAVAGTGTDTTRNTPRSVSPERRFKTSGGFGADETLTYAGESLALGTGLSFATIIGDAGKYFLARIRALEEDGHARILSQPSVLTLNNVEALLEHSQTFYVRVAGDQEVDLFDVSAGVVLRVTPHIVEDDEKTRIKLAVDIEDGSFSDTSVDGIPVVRKSTINTQAVINKDESLLIGGYYYEVDSKSARMVPCLGGIPALGYLFKQEETTKTRSKRVFLITPKIITHDAYPAVEDIGGPVPPPPVTGEVEERVKEESPGSQEIREPMKGPPMDTGSTLKGREPGPGASVMEDGAPSGGASIGEVRPGAARDSSSPEAQDSSGRASPMTGPVGERLSLTPVEKKDKIYGVQVGSFLKMVGAKRKAAELRDMGFSPHIYWIRDNTDRIWYVVLLGVYEDRGRAREIALGHEKEAGSPLVIRLDPMILGERKVSLD